MSHLNGAVRFRVKRVERMGSGDVETIVLRTTEGDVGAALRQPDEGQRPALGVEYHHAVEVFRLAFKLVNLAPAHIGWLTLQGAVAAPAASILTGERGSF